jgi:hypothetical protein
LSELPEEVVDVIELAHHILEILFALLITFVALVEISRDLSDPLGFGLDLSGFLIESIN